MYYKVETGGGWFVVETTSKAKAKSEGVKTWGCGSGGSITVTRATEEDIIYFKNLKGENATTASNY